MLQGFGGDRFRTAIARACTAAGVPAFSPHDLRHHWAFDALLNHTPLNVVQADGGWETEYMPLRYAHQVGATGGGATITEEDEPSP